MGIVDNMKEVADLVKKLGDIDLNRKIVNLEGEVLDLTRAKRQADQRIEELEGQLVLKAKMTHKAPFYFQEGDPTPFCPACYENQVKAIHVVVKTEGSLSTQWECPGCKSTYMVPKEGPQDAAKYQSLLNGSDQGWMGR